MDETPAGKLVVRQASFNPEPLMSKSVPHRCLQDTDGQPLHSYGYYVRLHTHRAWRVPLLHGRCPKVPGNTSPPKEKCMYTLFLMLLVRPHRPMDDFCGVHVPWSCCAMFCG